MSGPSPGRQEAGAPCTGESLVLLPSLSFFSFCPSSLQTFTCLKRRRSDVWCPKGIDYCWPREIWSVVGDFALSWCSPDLSPHTDTYTVCVHTSIYLYIFVFHAACCTLLFYHSSSRSLCSSEQRQEQYPQQTCHSLIPSLCSASNLLLCCCSAVCCTVCPMFMVWLQRSKNFC